MQCAEFYFAHVGLWLVVAVFSDGIGRSVSAMCWCVRLSAYLSCDLSSATLDSGPAFVVTVLCV